MYILSQAYHWSLIIAPANLTNCDGRTLRDSSFSVGTFHQMESIGRASQFTAGMVEELREQVVIQSLLNPGPAPH